MREEPAASVTVTPKPPSSRPRARRLPVDVAEPESTALGEPSAWSRSIPAVNVETGLYVALTCLAFVLRFWDIGSRAMHGDESVHAWLAWNLYNGTGYHYDPVYHGPLQFLVTSVFFFLFGVSNTTARLMAVLFGTALVPLMYMLRTYIGRTAALLAALFVCISPAFVYVSRLERDDIFTSLFAFLLAMSIFQFVRTRSERYLYLGAAAAALSLSAMENTYITLFIFGTYLGVVMVTEAAMRRSAPALTAFWQKFDSGQTVAWRSLTALGFVFVAAFALTVITGSYLPVPVIAAVAIVTLVHRQTVLDSGPAGQTPYLDALSHVDRRQWLNVGAIVLAILVLTFSTMGSNLTGIWDSAQPIVNGAHTCPGNSFPLNPCRKDIIGGLFYWLSQHQVHRGGQPWFYYSMLYGLYEQIGLFAGVGGLLYALRRPQSFTSFLVYWGVLSLGVYSWAGEKFSWLMIHPLLPFLILAAVLLSALFRSRAAIRIPVFAAIAALLLTQIHNLYEVNFVNAADPVEMMVYVQSSPDTPRVAADILNISNKVTNGTGLHVTVDADETWPFAWYLRDMKNVAYPTATQLTERPFIENPVQIVDALHQSEVVPLLKGQYSSHLYRLRWWFPEDYKSWTWSRFWSQTISPSSWRAVLQWQTQRKAFGPKGAVWFYYYVKRGLVTPY